jgi:glutathione S-transferase
MKLYEFAPTRSIRVRWTLQELGVAFEAVTIDMMAGEHRSPQFLKINPAGKIPVLVDGDLTLTESVAICVYLAEKYRERDLIPNDPRERARLNQWLLFTATELEQPLWRIARHTNLYPKDKRLPAEIELARSDFTAMAKVLNEHMDGRTFVLGNRVSVADFVLAYTLDWAQLVKLLGGLPRLEAYVERMYARPCAPMHIADAFASIRR